MFIPDNWPLLFKKGSSAGISGPSVGAYQACFYKVCNEYTLANTNICEYGWIDTRICTSIYSTNIRKYLNIQYSRVFVIFTSTNTHKYSILVSIGHVSMLPSAPRVSNILYILIIRVIYIIGRPNIEL